MITDSDFLLIVGGCALAVLPWLLILRRSFARPCALWLRLLFSGACFWLPLTAPSDGEFFSNAILSGMLFGVCMLLTFQSMRAFVGLSGAGMILFPAKALQFFVFIALCSLVAWVVSGPIWVGTLAYLLYGLLAGLLRRAGARNRNLALDGKPGREGSNGADGNDGSKGDKGDAPRPKKKIARALVLAGDRGNKMIRPHETPFRMTRAVYASLSSEGERADWFQFAVESDVQGRSWRLTPLSGGTCVVLIGGLPVESGSPLEAGHTISLRSSAEEGELGEFGQLEISFKLLIKRKDDNDQ